MSKKDIFQEALADAKSVKSAALELAKNTIAEHFTPKLKTMIDAKLTEDLDEEYSEEEEGSEEVKEVKKKSSEEASDELNLESLLKELEDEEDGEPNASSEEGGVDERKFGSEEKDGEKGEPMDEKKKASSEEKKSSEDDELDEEREQYNRLKEKFEPKKKSSEEDKKSSEEGEEEKDFNVDEEFDLEALLKEIEDSEEGSEEEMKEEKFGSEEKDNQKKKEKPMDENNVVSDIIGKLKSGAKDVWDDLKKIADPKQREEVLQAIRNQLDNSGHGLNEKKSSEEEVNSELNEAHLISAKTLFFRKIMIENDNLTKSDKVGILKQFDNATSVREAKLVYNVISESYKAKKISKKNSIKKNLRESAGYASKASGVSTKKESSDIIDPLYDRWQTLSGLKK